MLPHIQYPQWFPSTAVHSVCGYQKCGGSWDCKCTHDHWYI